MRARQSQLSTEKAGWGDVVKAVFENHNSPQTLLSHFEKESGDCIFMIFGGAVHQAC